LDKRVAELQEQTKVCSFVLSAVLFLLLTGIQLKSDDTVVEICPIPIKFFPSPPHLQAFDYRPYPIPIPEHMHSTNTDINIRKSVFERKLQCQLSSSSTIIGVEQLNKSAKKYAAPSLALSVFLPVVQLWLSLVHLMYH